MGCSTSKLDNEEVVLICKERRRFIRQAVDQRYDLAAAHVAYIHSLKNVGNALRHFVERDEMLLDSSMPTSPGTTPIFTPPAPATPETSTLPEKSSSPSSGSPAPPDSSSPPTMSYLRSGSTPSMYFEDRPPSPENMRMESYSVVHHFGMDDFFSTRMPPTPPPVTSSYNNPDYLPSPPSPPQNSTWDFFNPFTSLDNPYPYHDHRRLSIVSDEEDIRELKQLREEEGIPELEDDDQRKNTKEEGKKVVQVEEKTVEAVPIDPAQSPVDSAKEQAAASEPSVESSADALTQAPSEPSVEALVEAKAESIVEGVPSKSTEDAGEAVAEKAAEKVDKKDTVEKEVKDKEVTSEKITFPPFVIRKAMNMLEVIKDIEEQFTRAYESGMEVSSMLEASTVHYSSSFNEIKEHSAKVLNSIPLFRSSSSRSSSSRTHLASLSSKDDIDDSSSDFTEDCAMISGSHVSTLDRLYAWEKKLYDEVKAGERIRITYEKKCMQLRNQDAKGEDPQLVDKTRAAIKSLHTRIRVSIHAVDSVSKRIQMLRDTELQPQLAELIQGLMRMWKAMLECHQIQYQIISEAKSLRSPAGGISTESQRQATIQLENELHGWYTSFSNWIGSQKAYVQALNGWLSKCIILVPEGSTKGRVPSPSRVGAPPVFTICSDWCHAFEKMSHQAVADAIGNFVTNVRALWEQQDEEHRQRRRAESLAKDLDRKVVTLQRVESRRLERQVSSGGQTVAIMADRKISIDSFRKRVEEEKAKHHKVLQETQNATLNILQTGLTSVFEALVQFADVVLKTYKELHELSERAKFPQEKW